MSEHPSPQDAMAVDTPYSAWRDLRDALRGTHHDYTSGPLGRSIFLLAVPMVVEMAMESIFAVVDVFFVGRISAAARIRSACESMGSPVVGLIAIWLISTAPTCR